MTTKEQDFKNLQSFPSIRIQILQFNTEDKKQFYSV